MSEPESNENPITKADLEAKFRQVGEPAADGVGAAQSTAKALLIGAVVVVVVGAFLLGRRRGKRSNRAVIEIQRL